MRTTKKKLIHQCQWDAFEKAPRSAEAKEYQGINHIMSLLHGKEWRQFAGLLAPQCGRVGLEPLMSLLIEPSNPPCDVREQRCNPGKAERNRVWEPGVGRQLVEKYSRRF